MPHPLGWRSAALELLGCLQAVTGREMALLFVLNAMKACSLPALWAVHEENKQVQQKTPLPHSCSGFEPCIFAKILAKSIAGAMLMLWLSVSQLHWGTPATCRVCASPVLTGWATEGYQKGCQPSCCIWGLCSSHSNWKRALQVFPGQDLLGSSEAVTDGWRHS